MWQIVWVVPTNLQIDDRLLAKAQKVGGFRTKKDTVNHALSEFVRRRQQKDIASLFGKIDFAPDFDHKNYVQSGEGTAGHTDLVRRAPANRRCSQWIPGRDGQAAESRGG